MTGFNCAQKVALVTGANRGIGRAFVDALLSRKVEKIYATARTEQALKQLSSISHHIEAVLLDINNDEQVKRLAQQVEHLDLLINNAGIVNACFTCDDQAPEVARLEMQTNYFSTLNLTLKLLPMLRKSPGAAIVNISSLAALSNLPSISPYSASKAALRSMTQGLRLELRNAGILVAGVYPGPIDTRMTRDMKLQKAPPSEVAEYTLDAIAKGEVEIFPDAFARQRYQEFIKHPSNLEEFFAQII